MTKFGPRSRGEWLLLLGILAVGVLSFIRLPLTFPAFGSLTPLIYTIAAFADVSTAIILLSRGGNVQRSEFVVALAFGVTGVLTTMVLACYTVKADQTPNFGDAQSGIWMYVAWHVYAVAGAFALALFGVLRHVDAPVTPRFAFLSVSSAGAGVALSFFVAFGPVHRLLPALAGHGRVHGLIDTGIGPTLLLFSAVATVALFSVSTTDTIERAYAFTILALTFDQAALMTTERFSIGYFGCRILILIASTIVLVRAFRTLIEKQAMLSVVEVQLLREQRESRKRASRIRALWAMASIEEQAGAEHYRSILQLATANLRQDQPMTAYLSHLDGDEIVVDVAVRSGHEGEGQDGSSPSPRLVDGERFPAARGIRPALSPSEGTRAWDALPRGAVAGTICEEFGWRSLVVTQKLIGRKMYFMVFGSTNPMTGDPYVEDDIAYVDVIASFVANRVAQLEHVRRLQFQMEHDALTGLGTRTQFRRAIREAMDASSGAFAVALVDLDGFRRVNDNEGYLIGDELLVEVAHELQSVSPSNLVGRMSADEFGIILADSSARGSVHHALEPYQALFRKPFATGNLHGTQTLLIGASLGVAQFPSDGSDPEALLKRAGVALSVAKDRGGSTAVIFDATMQAKLDEQALRVNDLKTAIHQGQLFLEYQPTFDLKTLQIVGAEALVRWMHPSRGRLPPADFIAFASRNGLIASLSQWVFDRVVEDIRSTQLPPSFRCYFNLAPSLLEDATFIRGVLETVGADPSLAGHLGAEITETAAMFNIDRSMVTLGRLRGAGLRIAIDDFGTGYSSLSYLKKLTVDMIKIDKSFVDGLPHDDQDARLCETLIDISEDFRFATLAEGIETEAQAQWLSAHGCVFGQGYLIAKPMRFDQLVQRLENAPEER